MTKFYSIYNFRVDHRQEIQEYDKKTPPDNHDIFVDKYDEISTKAEEILALEKAYRTDEQITYKHDGISVCIPNIDLSTSDGIQKQYLNVRNPSEPKYVVSEFKDHIIAYYICGENGHETIRKLLENINIWCGTHPFKNKIPETTITYKNPYGYSDVNYRGEPRVIENCTISIGAGYCPNSHRCTSCVGNPDHINRL